jgi:lipoprotein releasing system LolC/E family transmembrane protein
MPMSNLSFFIALRYLRGTSHEKNISMMVKVCFAALFIGSFSLALIAAIMNGSEKMTREKMQGINPHIIIRTQENSLDFAAFNTLFSQKFSAIAHAAPSETKYAIVQSPTSDEINDVMIIKGIDPDHERLINNLETKIIAGGKTLTEALANGHLLIGAKTARFLNVNPGDTLTLFFTPEATTDTKIVLESSTLTIGGIFQTGIDDIDSTVIFCSLDFLKSLFPDTQTTQIGIKLHNAADEQKTITQLKSYFPTLEIYSWQDLYTPLFSALKLEKYAMFLIMILITLVASMNCISLLFMQIVQKRADIAMLLSMGMKRADINAIFLTMGMILSCVATISGLALATIASWLLQTFPFISLPDVYYMSHLPARMEISLILLVFFVVMGLSFFASWIPAKRASALSVATVLRFEG